MERRSIATKLTVLSAAFGLVGSCCVLLLANANRAGAASLLGVSANDVMLATTLVLVGALGSNHLQVAWSIWRAENRAVHTAVASTERCRVSGRGRRIGNTHHLGAVSAGSLRVCHRSSPSANPLRLARPRGGTVSYSASPDTPFSGLPVPPYLLALWGLGAEAVGSPAQPHPRRTAGRFTLAHSSPR